jgi:hypothetical protein
MSQDQFHKGLANILSALNTALTERGVAGALVKHNIDDSHPKPATFAVTVNGKTETQAFSREEIEDSGEAIDAPAAAKVRMLVSHFVR